TWKINNNEFDPGTFGFFLNKTGLYTLEVKYTDNCSLFDTAIVDVFTKNRLELGMDTILCQGETVHLKPIVESDWSFTWSTGSSRPDVYINKSGIVWLRVMNAKGCI